MVLQEFTFCLTLNDNKTATHYNWDFFGTFFFLLK